MNTNTFRTFFGFIFALGVPALILYLLNLIFVSQYEAAWGAKLLALFAYLSAILLGLPAYFYMHKKRLNKLGEYFLMGALVVFICYALIFGSLFISNWKDYPEHALLLLKNSIGSAVVAVLYGAVASAIFWFIRKWSKINF